MASGTYLVASKHIQTAAADKSVVGQSLGPLLLQPCHSCSCCCCWGGGVAVCIRTRRAIMQPSQLMTDGR